MYLNHVALMVRDRERSATFYAAHFGLAERVHEDAHLLILRAGDRALLALKEGSVPKDLPSFNHFGFQAESPSDVRSARERFRLAGVRETQWQDSRPVRVQVADPDGYRVDLYAY
jgi:catechol 2,3-dioxygenase-like lactoylglutathione lyase family enzyme